MLEHADFEDFRFHADVAEVLQDDTPLFDVCAANIPYQLSSLVVVVPLLSRLTLWTQLDRPTKAWPSWVAT